MSNLSLFSSLPISVLSLCLEAAEAENASSDEEGVFLNKLFEVYSTIHCSVCVGVTGCVAVTVGSDSEDDDNDEEKEDDEECLKKIETQGVHACVCGTECVCIKIFVQDRGGGGGGFPGFGQISLLS